MAGPSLRTYRHCVLLAIDAAIGYMWMMPSKCVQKVWNDRRLTRNLETRGIHSCSMIIRSPTKISWRFPLCCCPRLWRHFGTPTMKILLAIPMSQPNPPERESRCDGDDHRDGGTAPQAKGPVPLGLADPEKKARGANNERNDVSGFLIRRYRPIYKEEMPYA